MRKRKGLGFGWTAIVRWYVLMMLGGPAQGWELSHRSHLRSVWGGKPRGPIAVFSFSIRRNRRQCRAIPVFAIRGRGGGPRAVRVFPISRRYVPRGNWNGGSRAKAAWGRGFLVWLACLWIPPIPFKEDNGYATPIGEGDVVKDGVRSALGAGNDGGFMYFPPIRAGGGPTKRGKVKLEQEVLNSTKCEPVS